LKTMRKMLPVSLSAYGGGLPAVPILCLALLFKPLSRILTYSFAYADRQTRYTKKGYPINYLAIVRRPA
jgi:hypothetical protein